MRCLQTTAVCILIYYHLCSVFAWLVLPAGHPPSHCPRAMHTFHTLLTNVPYTYHMMAHNYTISLHKHTNNHTFLLSNFSSGKYFWRLTREKHLVSLRPAQIHRFWRGLPANLDSVDAVYERPGDHKIVFFKGKCLDLIFYEVNI